MNKTNCPVPGRVALLHLYLCFAPPVVQWCFSHLAKWCCLQRMLMRRYATVWQQL